MTEENKSQEVIEAQEEIKMQNVARTRVGFKIHLGIFVLVNLLIWIIWYFVIQNIVKDEFSGAMLKTCISITAVWLILLIGHYLIAYKWNKTFVEKELKKLKKQRAKQLKEIEDLKQKMQSVAAPSQNNNQ